MRQPAWHRPLPKFETELFAVRSEQGFYLIPTAEVPVTNLARDNHYRCRALPRKHVCHTRVSAARPVRTEKIRAA